MALSRLGLWRAVTWPMARLSTLFAGRKARSNRVEGRIDECGVYQVIGQSLVLYCQCCVNSAQLLFFNITEMQINLEIIEQHPDVSPSALPFLTLLQFLCGNQGFSGIFSCLHIST